MKDCLWILSAAIILLLSAPATAQTEDNDDATCSDISDKLKDLEIAINSLCGQVPASTPVSLSEGSCTYPTTWTSLPLYFLGELYPTRAGTTSYEIPATVPDSAKEVLVYVTARVKQSNPHRWVHIKIFTEDGGIDYVKYIGILTWSENRSLSSNSDNLWFPMPRNRRIQVTVDNAYSGDIYCYFYVIGYR